MNKLYYWVWLTNLAGIFPNKITSLLDYFDSVEEIYKAGIEDYQKIPGISRADSFILNSKDLSHARGIVEKTLTIGGKILTYDDIDYPDSLRKIDSPPYVIYLKGEIMQWDRLLCIGVVGTRRCSEYGRKIAQSISFDLAGHGITIVSGMARGIDSISAKAALQAGNKTIAVLGCGLDVIYPPENGKLMAEIEQNGTIITEYPIGAQPIAHHFPERNRIISGLSRGVLAVEAPLKSGTLITANYALDSGKDVFSVPGDIFRDNAAGTNLLIKHGAKITTSAMDILEEYVYEIEKLQLSEVSDAEAVINNVKKVSIDDEKYALIQPNEKAVIRLLIEKNRHIDDIRASTGLDIGTLNAMLPMLEMMGFIQKLPGENYKLEV